MELNTISCGECLEVMKGMEDNSIDSIVTDPPYGLKFMGKTWDYDVPSVEIWKECLRVLKPGGFLLSFAGTRTYHRMVVNIEDAGFQVRDMIAWIYGSGFPKSLNVGKVIDKKFGKKGEIVGYSKGVAVDPKDNKFGGINRGSVGVKQVSCDVPILSSATPEAKQWEGWGTALKPACEPICVARKPLEGTVAENVLKYGVGGMNIDGCRVGTADKLRELNGPYTFSAGIGHPPKTNGFRDAGLGRWPANLIHDGSEEVEGLFPYSTTGAVSKETNNHGKFYGGGYTPKRTSDSGSASRFFYCAKANKTDRDEGCEELENKQFQTNQPYGKGADARAESNQHGNKNNHPTVKPTALMRYLCKLVTPPNGIILDPFFGSGSTGKAAKLEHFNYIGIEREADYCEIARRRIAAAKEEPVKKVKTKVKTKKLIGG